MNTYQDVLEGRCRWSYELRDGIALIKELAKLGRWVFNHSIGDPPYDEKTHDHARSLKNGGSDIAIDFDHLKPQVGRDDHGNAILVPACDVFVPDLLTITERWILQCCTQEMARDYEIATGDAKFRRKDSDLNYIRAQWWVRTNGAPQISGDRPAVPGETIVTMHSHRWTKKRWNGGGDRGFYIGPICDEHERLGHGTQKPEWLMLKLIEKHTDEDDIVFDWSGGVATTGAACLKLRRRFVGCELKGPCPKCGGGFPKDWDACLRRKVLALVPDLRECRCKPGHINYHAIGTGRLKHIANSMKQQTIPGLFA